MTNPLLDQFLAEAADLLERLDADLLRLEQDPGDPELVNELFRAAHTLKGSSGLFPFGPLTRLTHAAEDLMDAVRAGRVLLDGDIVDALLACFDQVRRWLGEVERTGTLPPDAEADGRTLAVRLRGPLGDPEPSDPDPRSGGVTVIAGPAREAPDWLGVIPESLLRELAVWLGETDSTIRAVRYSPDPGCFFRGEDPLRLLRQLPALEHLDIRSDEPLPDITRLDEYECRLRFTALTRASSGEISHVFRYVSEQVELAEIDGPALGRRPGSGTLAVDEAGASPESDAPTVVDLSAAVDQAGGLDREVARQLLEAQREVVTSAEDGPGWAAVVRSAVATARGVAALLGADPDRGSATLRKAVEQRETGPLLGWFAELLALIDDAAPRGAVPGGPSPGQGAGDPAGAAPGPAGADAPTRAEAAEEVTGHGTRLLKVEQSKVDRLLDLAGELVVAKNSLPFVADEAREAGQLAIARRVKDEYTVISRVSEELQHAVMDVRMLSVSVAFARVPRLVRDLARKLGKDVRLVQEGEDAAADKDIIEHLSEPLVHLVRNCLDHGVETPRERVSLGKPPQATLVLRAVPEGDAVIVEVADDGRGIDPDAVRAAACRRGLIDEAEAAGLGDEDAVQLLFRPGFSTATEISDVSGRGVGLDAVRSDIERLGGSVSLTSRPGEGTTVRLRLPLTMAVSRVLLLTAGGQRFGVRVDDVIETVSVPPGDVEHVAGQEILLLRDELVPLVRLTTVLELAGTTGTTDLHVLVVRTPTGPLGLVADRFLHDVDVILKPLEGLLVATPGYCGTALLGDGYVLLVLDVKELNDRATATR